ncbi:MAG: SMI1/KNR4 family protein [Pseudomonadota bacterium]
MKKIISLLNALKTEKVTVTFAPVNPMMIKQAQNFFGFTFCSEYHWFLQTLGYLKVGRTKICGIDRTSIFASNCHSCIWETLKFRRCYSLSSQFTVIENCNNQWYFLLNHHNGKLYGFDALETRQGYLYQTALAVEHHHFFDYLVAVLENAQNPSSTG